MGAISESIFRARSKRLGRNVYILLMEGQQQNTSPSTDVGRPNNAYCV